MPVADLDEEELDREATPQARVEEAERQAAAIDRGELETLAQVVNEARARLR